MTIRQRIAKLIDVKSVITLCLIGLFMVQTIRMVEISQTFLYLLTSVVTFYFAKQDKNPEARAAVPPPVQQPGLSETAETEAR